VTHHNNPREFVGMEHGERAAVMHDHRASGLAALDNGPALAIGRFHAGNVYGALTAEAGSNTRYQERDFTKRAAHQPAHPPQLGCTINQGNAWSAQFSQGGL